MTAIKACLEEGLEPVCFERRDNSGGMWYYSPVALDGLASVMRSTIINTSKEAMAFSDFPPPAENANFMHNSKLLEYMRMYADKYQLAKHIRFGTEIVNAKRAPDFDKTGKWELTIRQLDTGVVTTETFNAVMVCSGHHADKHVARFPGDTEFKGTIVHSHDYRSFEGYENKRVVVVGIGNSGLDVAVELSHVCKQVYLSTRRGAWVVSRVSDNGWPFDVIRQRRIFQAIMMMLPWNVKNNMLEKAANRRIDHALYGLKPAHRYLQQHVTINDELPNRVASGAVIIKPNVRRMTATTIEFDDGTVAENVDAVILATGYTFGFPFLEKDVLNVQGNKVELYKYMFPPRLQPRTLAVIGCIQPLGAINPISELQSRLATGVFMGRVQLPSAEQMLEDINMKRSRMAWQYVQTQRHTIQVNWMMYMDELAQMNGNAIQYKELLKNDWRLFKEVYFGVATPYQYRLFGPGKWAGAREAILTQNERITKPLMTRQVPMAPTAAGGMRRLLVWALTILLCALLYQYFFSSSPDVTDHDLLTGNAMLRGIHDVVGGVKDK